MTLKEHLNRIPTGLVCITGTDRKVLKVVADRVEPTRRLVYYLPERDLELNQQWGFVQRLKVLTPEGNPIIITQCPWIISDTPRDRVLIMGKSIRDVSQPEFQTFGASVNKITMCLFGRSATIGDYAASIIQTYQNRMEKGEDPTTLIGEMGKIFGDSIELTLTMKCLLDREDSKK